MTDYARLKTKAEYIGKYLKRLELADQSGYRDFRVIWKEETPEALRDWWANLSGNMTDHTLAEMDETYAMLEATVDIILTSVNDDASMEDVREAIYNADLADDGTAYRLLWLVENLDRIDICNEWGNETQADGIAEAVGGGQNRHREQYCITIFEAIAKLAKVKL